MRAVRLQPFRLLPMNLDDFPRIPLAHLPTALEAAPRLGEAFGLPRLWVKRDDATGLAMGGNKARKLEYLMAEAAAQGADVVFTTGGVQSNHARMTAAAACKLGMRSELFLCDPAPAAAPQGNLLLDHLFGAAVHFIPGLTLAAMYERMEARAAELRVRGHRPYIIPVGGSTALGSLGYVRAVRELASQAEQEGLRIDAMTVATGSTGTLTGVLLGARMFMPETRVYGISVSPWGAAGRQKCAGLIAEAGALLGVAWSPSPDEIPMWDDWLGAGYGVPTPEGLEVIRMAAELEGYLLDPVYTGKALAGTRGLAQRGELRREETVVFWHTGGAPALFACNDLFGSGESDNGCR
jgi:D-cysteine desulfhydrase family pyridoxal phosphate-dependent enzyme